MSVYSLPFTATSRKRFTRRVEEGLLLFRKLWEYADIQIIPQELVTPVPPGELLQSPSAPSFARVCGLQPVVVKFMLFFHISVTDIATANRCTDLFILLFEVTAIDNYKISAEPQNDLEFLLLLFFSEFSLRVSLFVL